jgi:hypothetical protein
MRGQISGRSLACMLRTLIAALALVAAGATGGTAAAPARCASSCAAAYTVIADALPRDRANVLARAIVGTPGFDYDELARALRVRTTTQVKARWPRFCRRLYPRNEFAAEACDELLLGPSRRPAA